MSHVAESILPRSPPQPTRKGRVAVNTAAALVVTALEVAILILGTHHAAPPTAPGPIAVRLVALPTPAPVSALLAEAVPTVTPAPPRVASPVPEPPQPAPEPPKPVRVEPLAPRSKPAPLLAWSVPEPVPAVPPEKPRLPAPHVAQGRPASPRTASPRPSAAASEALSAVAESAPLAHAKAPGGGTIGARAIDKPMPEIPEELRRHPMTVIAVVRFRVAADGTAAIELIHPTAIPLLNTALLTALTRWRFFPAIVAGRPVASTIDIRIPVEIK